MASLTSFAGFALQIFVVKQHIPWIVILAWCVRYELRWPGQKDQTRSPRPHAPRSLKVWAQLLRLDLPAEVKTRRRALFLRREGSPRMWEGEDGDEELFFRTSRCHAMP